MRKWKSFLSVMLAGALVVNSGLTGAPVEVMAAAGSENGVQTIYQAFYDAENVNIELVDPEFGNQAGALNSSLSPRVLELKYQGSGGVGNVEDNGKMYATFECNRLPKSDAALVGAKWNNSDNINEQLSSFPIYESIDGGLTWGGGENEKPARGGNYLPVGYVQNQGAENGVTGMRNCPELYEMPETVGDLKKGTVLCAGNSIQAGENGAAADVMESDVTYLDLCVTDDLGRNWEHHSSILGPIDGKCRLEYNTVWEPFFLTHGGRLYCFYSDEAIDNTTDQDISYVYYDGAEWSEKHQVIYSRGKRPGMPVVSQLEDGRFMLTYERNGGSSSGYILSAENDPTKWYDKNGVLKDTTIGEYVAWDDGRYINNSGSPYHITTADGTVLYNNNALSSIWANSSKAPDAENSIWINYYTGLGNAYNRQMQQLSNGKVFAVAGWNDKSIQCVTLDYSFDLEETGYLENGVLSGDKSVYLAVDGGYIDDGRGLICWTGPEGNQYWEFQNNGNDEYYLLCTNSGRVATAASTSEGSNVIQKEKRNGDSKQLWIFEAADQDGYYRIRNVSTGFYLTSSRLSADAPLPGTIIQSVKTEADAQMWKPSIPVNSTEPEEGETYNVSALPVDGVEIEVSRSTVSAGKPVTITITPKEGCKSIDKIMINGEEQSFVAGDNGVVTITQETVKEDLVIDAKTTLDDWYVSIPTNHHTGRNQCLSPRLAEGLDGALYCTFESAIPSAEADGEFVFPIYKSLDKGKTWDRVGEVVNDDEKHPDEYYKVNYDGNGIPTSAEEVDKDAEGAVCHPWMMHNCPQLFVLPEALGNLPAGTLLCAGDAVTIEKNAKSVSDAGDGGLWKTSLDLYYSTDGGVNWTFHSTIAEGGRNIMGYDPVWEPYFVFYDNQLICYYSDETNPNNKGQKLVHKIMDSSEQWSAAVDDVAFSNGNYRPGMPIVSQMENGKWIMVYESVGMTNPIKTYYKIADDPYNWNPTDWGTALPGIKNVYGGSPFVITLQDGRVAMGTGSLSEIFINTKKDASGAWIPYETGAIAGYNRCYYQLSSGEFLLNGSKGFDKQNNYIYVKSLNPQTDFAEDEQLTLAQHVENKAKNQMLGVWQGSANAGADVVTWTLGQNSMDQMWIPQSQDDGTFVIKNYNSGKVLAVRNKTIIQADEANEEDCAQRWSFAASDDNGYYAIRNEETGTYLSIGSSREAGFSLKLTDTAESDEQLWKFSRVSDQGEDFVPSVEATYEIQATAGEGGSITPSGIVKVRESGSQKFEIAASDGFRIQDVKVNDSSIGAVTEYTFNYISENASIEAVFEKIEYVNVTSEDTEHGKIIVSPDPETGKVEKGTDVVIQLEPDSGYQISEVAINDEPVGVSANYVFKNLQEDVKISAVFTAVEPGQLPVTVNHTVGGQAVPDVVTLNENESEEIVITAEEGYIIEYVNVGEEALQVPENAQEFRYTVVNNSQPAPVSEQVGDGRTVDEILPADLLTDETVDEEAGQDSGEMEEITEFVTEAVGNNVVENVKISVGFKKVAEVYEVIILPTSGGQIIADKTEVAEGGTVNFTIQPDGGYRIKDVIVNEESKGAVFTYQAANVADDVSIRAEFERINTPAVTTYSIYASAGQGGSITPESAVVVSGGSAEFAILPDEGYEISDVKVDGTSIGAVSGYTFEHVTANHEISAEFIAKEVPPSPTPDPTPTPDTEIKVNKVTGVKLTAGVTSVKLTWKKQTGVTGYKVYRYHTGKKKYVEIADIKNAAYTDKGVNAASSYRYAVRAYKKAGKTYYSSYTGNLRILTKPSAPSSVKAKRTSKVSTKSTASLSFKKVAGAATYRIYKYDKKTKKYAMAYRVVNNKLYQYNSKTKKYKKVNNVKVKNGMITCSLKNLNLKAEKSQTYVIKSTVSKSGYTTQYSANSKAVKIK